MVHGTSTAGRKAPRRPSENAPSQPESDPIRIKKEKAAGSKSRLRGGRPGSGDDNISDAEQGAPRVRKSKVDEDEDSNLHQEIVRTFVIHIWAAS
jgi:hypothetical protein